MGGSLGKHSGTAQLRCRSDVTRTDRAPLNKLWDIAKQEATSYSNGSVKGNGIFRALTAVDPGGSPFGAIG